MNRIVSRSGYFDHLDTLLALVVTTVAFGVYCRTAADTPLLGDSAEFQVLAQTFGAAHAPGYPVYLGLCYIVVALAPTDPAQAVTQLSAAMGAVALGLVYSVSRMLQTNRTSALLALVVLGSSPTFWSQAVIAEVYTTALAAAAACLMLLLRWDRHSRPLSLFCAGVIVGLGPGIHYTTTLLMPGAVFLLWLRRRRPGRPFLTAALGGGLGIAIYLVALAGADGRAPRDNIFETVYQPAHSVWQLPADAFEHVHRRLWFLVSAMPWQGVLDLSGSVVPDRLTTFARELGREVGRPTFAAAIAGLFFLARTTRSAAALLASTLAVHSGFALAYRVPDAHVFYLPVCLSLVVAGAHGLTAVASYLNTLSPAWRWGATVPAVALCCLFITPRLTWYWPFVVSGTVPFAGFHGYPVSRDAHATYKQARDVVGALPIDAVVFMPWREVYLYIYASRVTGRHAELRFIEDRPMSTASGLPASIALLATRLALKRPVYFARRWSALECPACELVPEVVGSRTMLRLLVSSTPAPGPAIGESSELRGP